MPEAKLKIIEEPNIIDDHLLDIIGNEFKFDHEKGLSEWLKNSVDAYITSEVADNDQYVIFRFTDGKRDDAVFECIDFVGMEELHIEKAFKRWGDPEAAKRGLNKRVYGGHGNGGKFYMRQMFEKSHFITYKNGGLSIFGFNENKKYGFADGYKGKKTKPTEALKIANLSDFNFPKGIKEKILTGKTGFTVVRGVGSAKMKNQIKFSRLIDKLKNHPQSRRILIRINVWATHNNFPEILLKPDEIKPLQKFEEPLDIEIPRKLKTQDTDEDEVELANKKYEPGRLLLRTSEEAFGAGSRGADLNRIDIVGEIGVIASYQLYELGVKTFPQASFIYGECLCPILEDPEMDSVKNDRTKLVENIRSATLLAWIRDQVDKYANEIAALERREQEEQRREISAAYNDYLNQWKDRFMTKFLGDIFHTGTNDGNGSEESAGGKKFLEVPENDLEFSFPQAKISLDNEERITLKALVPKPIPLGGIIQLKSTSKYIQIESEKITIKAEQVKAASTGETIAVVNFLVVGKKVGEVGQIIASAGKIKAEINLEVVEGSNKDKTKKPKTPQVLLSGRDDDPLALAPGGKVILGEREPLVYQRYQDVQEGIYWINTQSPLAKNLLDKCGDESTRWRDYLFQRYVDIFVKQALYELQKRDPEGFRADRIDTDILDGLTRKVHVAASTDLGKFFFEDKFESTKAEGSLK